MVNKNKKNAVLAPFKRQELWYTGITGSLNKISHTLA
jgi:hypothetical protein